MTSVSPSAHLVEEEITRKTMTKTILKQVDKQKSYDESKVTHRNAKFHARRPDNYLYLDN